MSVQYATEEQAIAKNAIIEHFVGKQIGSGSYRRVYELETDETCVIKIEFYGKDFCNAAEMFVWREVQHTPIENWFAPCMAIDSLGLALIQKKTAPFTSEGDFRRALIETRGSAILPDFFDDAHFGNFGMFEGRVACHDYGFNNFINHGVKVGWQKLAHEDGQYALL